MNNRALKLAVHSAQDEGYADVLSSPMYSLAADIL